MTTTNTTVKTRLSKDSDAIETKLTIDWDIEQDKIIELAQRAVVIQLQANYRISGTIPKEETVKVSDVIAKKVRVAKPLTPESVISKAKENPEFMAELLKLLQEGNKTEK